MSTQLDIANRALSRLGAPRISAFTDNIKAARAVNSAWEIVRTEVLRSGPAWKSATKRAHLFLLTDSVEGIAYTASPNRVRVTLTSHTFEDGDYIAVADVDAPADANANWIIGNSMTNSIDLIDPDTGDYADGSAWDAYTSGGTVTLKCLFGYENRIPLPDDCLRVLQLYEEKPTDNWEQESQFLLTDRDEPVQIRYIWDNQEPDSYDASLVSAMAARLSVEVCEELTQSASRKQIAHAEYLSLLEQAGSADAREQTPSDYTEGRWLEQRFR